MSETKKQKAINPCKVFSAQQSLVTTTTMFCSIKTRLNFPFFVGSFEKDANQQKKAHFAAVESSLK